MNNGGARGGTIWHDGDAQSPVVPEVSRVRPPARSIPRPSVDRDVLAAPAPGPAARAGGVGGWTAGRRERVRGGGAARLGGGWRGPACDPRPLAGVALRRRRTGRALRHQSGRGGL